ncbi:Acrylyl-CoA reductase AcuI [Pseudoclavibacter triregionum]|nr:Acrylyl-CoA reductase AcuI [Pseudoclavibacter triregionum]
MTRGYLATVQGRDIEVEFRDLSDEELGMAGAPEGGDVDLEVLWSCLNYKDGLLLAGKPGVARAERLVPGIDVVGRVIRSSDDGWREGEVGVIVGAGLGEERDGGLAERCRVPGALLTRIPDALAPRDAAAIGTAGFTAQLAVRALEAHPGALDGPVLVTGAAGGAGSIAVHLLARLGAHVVASTGRVEEEGPRLRSLGAAEVVDRAELGAELGKPMQRERWSAVVDSVGSTTLANAIAQTRREGIVAAFGLAQGPDLPATVLPFILRGVTLRGINSVEQPQETRIAVWRELAERLDLQALRASTSEIALEDAGAEARRILAGEVAGRTVIRVAADA